MAYTRRSQSGEPARSQAGHCVAIALCAACQSVPTAGRPPTGARVRVRPAASGRRLDGVNQHVRASLASLSPLSSLAKLIPGKTPEQEAASDATLAETAALYAKIGLAMGNTLLINDGFDEARLQTGLVSDCCPVRWLKGMAMPQTDPRIDDYIQRAVPFAQPILRQLRAQVQPAPAYWRR